MKKLERPQLSRFLAERLERRLFIIYGKPGQGKSVLLEDFCAQNKLQAVLHRSVREEKDILPLLSRISESLVEHQSCLRGLRAPVSREAFSDWNEKFRKRLQRLETPLYLVLDDYHLIDPSENVRALLVSWLAELPDTFRLILLSRGDLALPLSRYRCSGILAEVRDRDLAWSHTEVAAYCKQAAGLSLDEARAKKIAEISQGWPIALVYLVEQIAMLAVNEQQEGIDAFLADRRLPALDEYFSQEVLADLGDREAAALLRLSVFTSASAALMARVLGEKALELLEALSRRNYFLQTVDASLKIFTLHPLLASFLNARFSALPAADQAAVHNQAAAYFLGLEQREQALHHLLAAGESDRALDIFPDLAEALLEHHEIDSLNDLILAFPEQLREESTHLLYYAAITANLMRPLDSRRTLRRLLERFHTEGDSGREANIYAVLLKNHLFYQGNREAVRELLSLARDFLERAGSGLSTERREVLEALISLGRWWITPDLDEAYEIALRAEEISFQTRNREVLIFSRLALSRVYLDRGDFRQARGVLEQTERLLEQNPDCGQYDALLRFYLGDAFFYLGELDKALQQVERGLERSTTGFMFRRYLLLNQVLYLLYLPDTARAETILDGLQTEKDWGSLYTRYYSLYLTRMLLAYRQGNRERTAYFSRRLIDPENRALMTADYPYSYLAVAEVLVFLEDYGQAAGILEGLLQDAPADKFPYPAATAHALMGYIRQHQGDDDDSRMHFQRLRELLAEKGYRNLDICSGELLQRIGAAGGIPEFKSFPRLASSELHPDSEPGLYICTLGEFRIYLNGREIAPSVLARQKKVTDLLKLLIVHRERGIVKEVLYDLFWPGYRQKSARDNLNTILYRLRKILDSGERCILTDSSDIRLNREQCNIDADLFLENIARGEQALQQDDSRLAAALFYQAKSLYKGDFLEKDLYYDDIRDARETLRSQYLQLLFRLCRLSFESDEYFQALVLAKELIYRDPLCEPGYRLLMIACTLIGNRSEVPRLFDKLNARLQRFYGIGADPRTAELKDLLLSGTTPQPALWREEVLI